MSFWVFLLSIFFALIEAGLGYLLLGFTPAIELFTGVSKVLITGCVFALGMLLAFICIFIAGLTTTRLATYVRDHRGRSLILMLSSVILSFGIAAGAEALYQGSLGEPVYQDKTVFILDYSKSMTTVELPDEQKRNPWCSKVTSYDIYDSKDLIEIKTDDGIQYVAKENATPFRVEDRTEELRGSRTDLLCTAFENTIDSMPDGQSIAVICYDDEADVFHPWIDLNEENRAILKEWVRKQAEDAFVNYSPDLFGNDTDFKSAIQRAADLIMQGNSGNYCAIMISDGNDTEFVSVANASGIFSEYGIPIHTMLIGSTNSGELSSAETLEAISNETGGATLTADASYDDMTIRMSTLVNESKTRVGEDATPPQTILSPRYNEDLQYWMNPMLLRILLLFIVGFFFRLVTSICMGDNDESLCTHLIIASIVAIVSACAVEFGYAYIPMANTTAIIVIGSVYWLLMLLQIVKY